jgi:hypothetical protein
MVKRFAMRLTRILGEVRVTITVDVVSRTRCGGQRPIKREPDVAVRVGNPVGDW